MATRFLPRILGRTGLCCMALVLHGCYTLKQGYYQARLILKREPVDEVIASGNESPERLAKLRLLPVIRAFAEEKLKLTPGNSYQTYVRLDDSAVTWVVQAAEKRHLKQKTWWFPIIGEQPYLGFFVRSDAEKFQKKMVTEGYDTTLGGVQAFSLLGYFPDPLYSSMLDGNDIPNFVEVILHESVHATLYLPGFSSFNENLADFYARRGTVAFLRDHPELGVDIKAFQDYEERSLAAQKKFKEFLWSARMRLENFYKAADGDPLLASNAAFLEARGRLFDELADDYKKHMGGMEKGSSYEWAFRKGKLNNAVILGYSLYEARQRPFEIALANAGDNLPRFLGNLQHCLAKKPKTEEELWAAVEACKGGGT